MRLMNSLNSDLTNYDWRRWQHTEIGTLVFIVRAGRIPLIRKQRGLGAGKINGPGDRMESGEDALTCAVRELEEELVARPPGLTWAGDLGFQFTSGFSMLVHVVRSSDVAGKPLETAEAAPSWVSVDDIPYDEMCADDRHWMPFLLRHETYRGSTKTASCTKPRIGSHFR